MDNQTIKQVLDGYFIEKPVKRAYLFGSYARNEQTNISDIDILVELDFSKPIGLEYIQMCLDLETLLNKKVDLVTDGAISKYILPYINKEKILIYEKRTF